MRNDDYNDAFFDGVMTTLISIIGLSAMAWIVYLFVGDVLGRL